MVVCILVVVVVMMMMMMMIVPFDSLSFNSNTFLSGDRNTICVLNWKSDDDNDDDHDDDNDGSGST